MRLLQIWKFSRVFYYREISHMRSFVNINLSRYGEITLLFADISKSFPFYEFLALHMSFNALCENKILVKFSEFTVSQYILGSCANFEVVCWLLSDKIILGILIAK